MGCVPLPRSKSATKRSASKKPNAPKRSRSSNSKPPKALKRTKSSGSHKKPKRSKSASKSRLAKIRSKSKQSATGKKVNKSLKEISKAAKTLGKHVGKKCTCKKKGGRKRKPNAFILYYMEFYARNKNRCNKGRIIDMAKSAAKCWWKKTPEQRAQYKKKYCGTCPVCPSCQIKKMQKRATKKFKK